MISPSQKSSGNIVILVSQSTTHRLREQYGPCSLTKHYRYYFKYNFVCAVT